MIHARRRGMRYRRSRIDIFSQILVAAQGADTKKTKIMYKASLSDQALNEYLEILTDSDLLRYRLDIRTFKTTEKGLRFLETYNKMYLAMKAQQ
jgi:predicted transcriptional regulator